MNICFTYLQNQDGTIEHLYPNRNGMETLGDNLMMSCLKSYQILDDKKSFSFIMEYNSDMLKVLDIIKTKPSTNEQDREGDV